MTEVERERALTFNATLVIPGLEGGSTTLGLVLGFAVGLARGFEGCFGLAAG